MQNGNPDHLKSNVNNTTKTIFNSKNIDVDSNGIAISNFVLYLIAILQTIL